MLLFRFNLKTRSKNIFFNFRFWDSELSNGITPDISWFFNLPGGTRPHPPYFFVQYSFFFKENLNLCKLSASPPHSFCLRNQELPWRRKVKSRDSDGIRLVVSWTAYRSLVQEVMLNQKYYLWSQQRFTYSKPVSRGNLAPHPEIRKFVLKKIFLESFWTNFGIQLPLSKTGRAPPKNSWIRARLIPMYIPSDLIIRRSLFGAPHAHLEISQNLHSFIVPYFYFFCFTFSFSLMASLLLPFTSLLYSCNFYDYFFLSYLFFSLWTTS